MASKCISKLAPSRSPSASPNSLHIGLQVHFQSRSITASKVISKLTSSWHGEMVEPSWYPQWMREKEQLSLTGECRKRVRGIEGVPGYDELHTFHGSMRAQQGCMRNHSNLLELSNLVKIISSPLSPDLCISVPFHFSCISVCPPPASTCQIEWQWWWWETDIVTTKASQCIRTFSQSASPGAHPIMLEYHLQVDWPYVYISSHIDRYYMPYFDVLNFGTITMMNIIDEIPWSYETLRTTPATMWHQVSCSAAQRLELLLKSPTDLHRCLSCSKFCQF